MTRASMEVDEGGGQEATQADVEDQAALDNLDDLALDVLAAVELLLDAVPGALVLGTLLGEDQTTVLVLLLENQGLDGVAHADDVGGVGILADGKLADGDDALGLEADVKQDLIALDLDDGARHQIALTEIGDGAVDEVVHLLVGNVVEREDGRVLNLTQRWTPFEKRGPDPMVIACSALPGARTPDTDSQITCSGADRYGCMTVLVMRLLGYLDLPAFFKRQPRIPIGFLAEKCRGGVRAWLGGYNRYPSDGQFT